MSERDHDKHNSRHGAIEILVRDGGTNGVRMAIAHASVALHRRQSAAGYTATGTSHFALACTDQHGRLRFDDLETEGHEYQVEPLHQGCIPSKWFSLRDGCTESICLELPFDVSLTRRWLSREGKPLDCGTPMVGDCLSVIVNHASSLGLRVSCPPEWTPNTASVGGSMAEFSKTATRPGLLRAAFIVHSPALPAAAGNAAAEVVAAMEAEVGSLPTQPISGQLGIALTRTETEPTEDLPLWVAIRNGTEALSFNHYLRYMDVLFGGHGRNGHKGGHHGGGFNDEKEALDQLRLKRFLPFTDSDAYRVLKAATEAFVMVNCAVLQPDADDKRDRTFHLQRDNAYLGRRDLPAYGDLRGAFNCYLDGPERLLPYLALVRRKLPDIPVIDGNQDGENLAVGFVRDKLANPCLVELIWSYWHEEAMLVQTMNAVTRRFQNRRSSLPNDPLANLEIDPLRPLSNLLWGYSRDEQHRLTVSQRDDEYRHQYGLGLRGKAVREFRAADTRSQFLEGFHHLLRLLTVFYRQDDDTTVKADAFPVLNALKEVHLVMSQGAQNQFGEMNSTARIEMLMQQWLLGRPEFREFLPTRIMVAYPEPWMDRVDAMKKLQGWTDTSVVHFRNLAIFGEQLLLSIRYGAWSEVYEPTQAFNWARFWRPQVQGYVHAYRAATGVDLSGESTDTAADSMLPSLLMQRRLAQQQRRA
jgi:hypothetical protein